VSLRSIQERKKAGLCRDCGKSPPAAGVARCQPCRERQNERVRHYYQRKRRTGKDKRWVIA
jgi:hypothetical protein